MLHSEQTRSSGPQPLTNPSTSHQQSPQSQSITCNQNSNSHIHTAYPTTSQISNPQFTTQHATPGQSYVALPVTQTQDVLLSTALVEVEDHFGNTMLARALLDSCSQHCLMTRSFSTKLNFEQASVHLNIQGIGSSQSVATKSVRAVVRPRSREISQYAEEIQFYVLPKLTVELPTASFDPTGWDLPEAASLADPQFFASSTIDLIIGAEYYMDLLRERRRKAAMEGPTLQDTVFGWIVSGRISNSFGSPSLVHVCSDSEIHDQLARFWELETIRSPSTFPVEESACENIFDETTFRDESGRFVVTLPKKGDVIIRLGESKGIATKRFMSLERRFARDPELRAVYTEFMHEYQALGHMKEVQGEAANKSYYYLPHMLFSSRTAPQRSSV
ncbi:uncharacterized protein LOC129780015 [Toxorhynchites rutilus septentrionalis]|uniref:uncharacterized protein LOC129780015 n=1 Tax=Toxorhynchites rutilus septentrionalis TaxID=329112 RepID=UPI002479E587|nr:uncharacterized protein LOC129780015 [Toxorhynchites rutilus septentrionalis]